MAGAGFFETGCGNRAEGTEVKHQYALTMGLAGCAGSSEPSGAVQDGP